MLDGAPLVALVVLVEVCVATIIVGAKVPIVGANDGAVVLLLVFAESLRDNCISELTGAKLGCRPLAPSRMPSLRDTGSAALRCRKGDGGRRGEV